MAWVGDPGTGKTTTARWLASGMPIGNKETTGHYFNAPPMSAVGRGNLAFRLLDGLLTDLTGSAPRRVGRSQPQLSAVVQDILAVMTVRNVSVLCIDEAGTLHPEALEGLVFVADEAQRIGQEFVCILIGMSGLPEHLMQNPRLDRRVTVRKRFTTMTEEDFVAFSRSLWQLEGVVPPVAEEEEAFVERLFEASGGNINAAVELMRDVTDAAVLMGRQRPVVGTLRAVVTTIKGASAEVMAGSAASGAPPMGARAAKRRKPAVVAVGVE